MKFKGEHKDVVLRGIELAGSDRAVAAGGMNEMIGLVERDGMWEPYGFEKKIERILPSGRSKIMVHKTSAGDNVLCLLRNDNTYNGVLKWVTKDDFLNPNVVALSWQDTGLTGVEEIAMVGNMITDQNLNSVLFANGEYSAFIVKPSPLELPNVSLRVTCDHQFTSNGKPDVSGSGNCIFAWQEMDLIDEKDSAYLDGVSVAKRQEMAISLATKVLGQWATKGGLTGYVMATVAYRLTNGEYILAAPPQLLGEPYVKYKDGTLNYKNVSTGALTADDPPKRIYYNVLIPGNVSDSSDVTSRVYEFINGDNVPGGDGYAKNMNRGYEFNAENYGYIKENINLIEDNCHILNGYRYKDDDVYAAPIISGLFERYKQVRAAHDDINKYRCVVTCRANALEYKIDSNIEERFAPSIDSVCIFLSKQVYGQQLTQEGFVRSTVEQSRSRDVDLESYDIWGFMQGLYPTPKSEEDIIEELKKCDIFYKVKEIPFDEIKASDGWIYVDLEGKLGDALLTQPHLPPSTFNYAEMSNGKLFTYNNRIHMFDYMQTPSKLSDIRPYWYQGGYGQWTRTTISNGHLYNEAIATWRVIAKCKNSEHGEYELDSGTADSIPVTWFGGLICYPNVDCYEMEIRVAMNNTVYSKVFSMYKWENVGVAAYWNPDLEPWEWADWDHTWTQEDPQPSMVVNTATNPHAYTRHLRVSDVAYPYFPASQTEIIGRSRIIGLAHLSVPLSQDAYGKTPLLVFCDDGIYTLGVDVTGAKAYDTKTPLVPEVCVARRSICSLGFAVLFASRRGLMICTEKGVEEFTPKLRGKLKHLPKSNGTLGTGLQYYYNAVNEPLLMHNGAGAIDGYSFDDFVQSERMETTYLATKNAVILYHESALYPYCYMVDVGTRVVTKLPIPVVMDDNNYPEQLFYVKDKNYDYKYEVLSAGLYSGQDYTQCLFQTRPLYLGGILRRSFRFLLRGHFYGANPETGQQPHRAGLYILGSLDGEHWKLMGAKEKNLSMEGFHDFGCETYRDEVAYLMVIFTGYLHKSSHIDKMEVDGMFN